MQHVSSISSVTAAAFRPTRTSHGWSGPDATDGAAGGAVASVAVRARPSVAVPGTTPALAGTGSGRTQQRGVRSDLVPGAGNTSVFRARLPVVIQYPSLQLTLPNGFDSWAQVLTDWRVSRAFDASRVPRCWAAEPELAAPFVAAISREICSRQLGHPPSELMVLRECVAEPTHERTGGWPYIELRAAMEAAQDRYLAEVHAERHSHPETFGDEMPSEVRRLQTAFFASRQRHAAAVEREQRAVARAFWKAHPRHGLADDFFADASSDSIPVRMARIEAAWWWRSFFTRLQAKSKRHHAADGRLLDSLPSLRAQAKKQTLAAQIAEWSEAAAAEWGWRGAGHYRRLAEYADKKARDTVAWFDHRAPGYRTTATTRHALDERLVHFLARHDPHAQLLAAERERMSEHWPN